MYFPNCCPSFVQSEGFNVSSEQLLLSFVGSKVIVCHSVICHVTHVIFEMVNVEGLAVNAMLILMTCRTTFVFMCRLKSDSYYFVMMSDAKCFYNVNGINPYAQFFFPSRPRNPSSVQDGELLEESPTIVPVLVVGLAAMPM